MRYLLDTNIVSELRHARPDPGLLNWFDTTAEDELLISVLTVGEIRYGVERIRRQGDDQLAGRLDEWLATMQESFGGRIFPVDTATAEAWGRIRAIRPVPVVDGLLAASCIAHELTLVTRNERDVADLGAAVHNPFVG